MRYFSRIKDGSKMGQTVLERFEFKIISRADSNLEYSAQIEQEICILEKWRIEQGEEMVWGKEMV